MQQEQRKGEEIASPHPESRPAPLQGILVADFTRVLAGPLATMILGDLGADVVKVERKDGGDDTRSWGPPFAGGHSSYYLTVNRNKRSVTLDLKNLEEQRAARLLCLKADVVVENFRAGTMQRLGLGFKDLRSENPRLVYCRISGLGETDIPGYDFLAQAAGGLMSVTGETDGRALKTGAAVVDVVAGLQAVIGILAALRERERSNRGQKVEVDLISSCLFTLVNQACSYLTAAVTPRRMGNQHPSISPYETYQTATGELAIAVGNDRQFNALCEALSLPELPADPRWATNAARVEHRDELAIRLEQVLKTRTRDQWVQLLRQKAVPCSPINDIPEAFAFAKEAGIDAVRHVRDAMGDTVPQVANPIRLSESPVSYRSPPPDLGEHSAEVLKWLALEEDPQR